LKDLIWRGGKRGGKIAEDFPLGGPNISIDFKNIRKELPCRPAGGEGGWKEKGKGWGQ